RQLLTRRRRRRQPNPPRRRRPMTLAASRQQAASRPRLLQAVFDAVQQPDIRKKLLFTAAMLVIFRFTAHIPIPGVDPAAVEKAVSQSQLLGLFNLFSGGALRR